MRPCCRPLAGALGEGTVHLEAELLEQARSADGDALLTDGRLRATTDEGLEVSGGRDLHTPLLGSGHDRAGEGVLRIGFDRGGEGHDLVLVDALDRDHIGHDRLAPGQRAGLVEDDDVQLPRALQREPVLDQEAVARPQRGADGDDQGDGQPKRVRAGDDEHRGGAHERLLWLAERQPHEKRHGTRSEGDVEEGRGRTVGKGLGPRAGRLGLGRPCA